MSLQIELTADQEEALLKSLASANRDGRSDLHDVAVRLPDGEVLYLDIQARPAKPAAPQKTPAEAIAAWRASGLPSVYARDPEDATIIARRLREQAETRDWSAR